MLGADINSEAVAQSKGAFEAASAKVKRWRPLGR